MSNDATGSAPPLPINLKGLQERKLLEAELMGHDAQLRNFTPLRDRLVASGQDATAMYRQIQSRRGHAMAELKKLTPGPVRPAAAPIGPLRAGSSALTLPIAAARLLQGNSPWFGSSGMVQMGRAQEGTNLQAQGHYPTSGSISTAARGATGFISFNGLLSVGPDEESLPQSDPYDPTLRYFWLHNWNYLIFFPAPRVTSTFTYSLGVAVLAYLFLHEGPVTLMSFVSVGETPDFVGTDVVVDTDAGWPLMVDLTQPYYANGSVWGGINYFGWVQGSSSVQRSFLVQGGHTPAVALVVGMVSAQAMATKIDLNFPGTYPSYISPGSSMYGSDGLVNFHYEPLPPELHP